MQTAVLLHDTNMSDLNYHVMTELNNWCPKEDIFLLVNNISSKVIKADFAIINSSRIGCTYNSLIIATSLDTARMLAKASVNSRKVYYIYSLDWLYTPFSFNDIYDLINNDDIELVVRSTNHQKLIQNLFGRTVNYVIPDFRLDQLWNSLDYIKKD